VANGFCLWCHQIDDDSAPTNGLNRPNFRQSASCPQCGRSIALVSIPTAAQIVKVSRKTIYDWLQKGLVSSVRTCGGRQLVCLSSLFDPREKV
jgi:excisionase family DNA binding protein